MTVPSTQSKTTFDDGMLMLSIRSVATSHTVPSVSGERMTAVDASSIEQGRMRLLVGMNRTLEPAELYDTVSTDNAVLWPRMPGSRNYGTTLWKMNVLAASVDGSFVFVAVANSIMVYYCGTHRLPLPVKLVRVLKTGENHDINQIKCGRVAGKSVLVTVDDGAFIRVFLLHELVPETSFSHLPELDYDSRQLPPLDDDAGVGWAYDMGYLGPRDPILASKPLCFVNPSQGLGVWGLDIFGTRLAVSANSHTITILDLSASIDVSTSQAQVSLMGHSHNIPCVSFSPCGLYLASSSIDSSCAVWDPILHRMSSCCKPSTDWGWSVTWLTAADVPIVSTTNLYNLSAVPQLCVVMPPRREARRPPRILTLRRNAADALSVQSPIPFDTSSVISVSMPIIQHTESAGQMDDGQNDLEEQMEYDDDISDDVSDDDLEETANLLPLVATGPSEPQSYPDLSRYLLLYGTRNSMFLVDACTMDVVARMEQVIPDDLPSSPYTEAMTRCSLLCSIPEYSAYFVGSQGRSRVAVLRVVKCAGQHRIIREKVLPDAYRDIYMPIAGMTVTKTQCDTYLLFILFVNFKLHTYEISLSNHVLLCQRKC